MQVETPELSRVCLEARSPWRILRRHGFELCLQGIKTSKAGGEAKARGEFRASRIRDQCPVTSQVGEIQEGPGLRVCGEP